MPMPKGFSASVETKAYLKKYLHAIEGQEIRFTSTNDFGYALTSFLNSSHAANKYIYVSQHDALAIKPSTRSTLIKEKNIFKIDTAGYDSVLSVCFSKSFVDRCEGNFKVNKENVIAINKIFEETFQNEVWKHSSIMSVIGIGIKDSLLEFCKSYNIIPDEDLPLKTLIEKEFRYRKKMQVNHPELSVEGIKNTIKKIILNGSTIR
jgi:hypothetical protein